MSIMGCVFQTVWVRVQMHTFPNNYNVYHNFLSIIHCVLAYYILLFVTL